MSDLYIFKYSSSGPSIIDISYATVTLGVSLTYNGFEQTQTIVSVIIRNKTLLEGTDYIVTDNTAINAGSYSLSILGIGAYGGTKTVSWSIAKAQGSISVDPSSLTIVGANSTGTATITSMGDGTISAVSSNTSVATVGVSGNTVTVTSVTSGDATVTVMMAAGTNYTGNSTTVSVSVMAISSTLADCTPAEIQTAAQLGIASSLWSVGDRTSEISFQNVTVGALPFNGLKTCAFIIGFNHNEDKEGIGIHFQVGMTTNEVKTAFCDSSFNSSGSGAMFHMNSSNTNNGGWNNSYMRTTICPAFKSALPHIWQNIVSATTKYSDNTGGGSDVASYITATTDDIFLLAEYEVKGVRTNANSAEQNYQTQYDYYKNGNSNTLYKHNDTSTGCYWWLRSTYIGNAQRFCGINVSGSAGFVSAAGSRGFVPAFRVA